MWISSNPTIQHIASTIEARRIELAKTSGFEKLYGRVTQLYFGGMTRHLAFLRDILRPGAQLAYVVSDQASYFRIKIPTGRLLADIATSLGYQLISIDLFRTRFSTTTKEQLREEVLVLRWPASSIHFVSNIPDANIRQERLAEMDIFSQENEEQQPNITASVPKINRYQKLMEHIFFSHYKEGNVQIEQDVALCAEKFSALICKAIAAQFIGENRIALFEFEQNDEGIKLYREQHYRLVSPEEMTETDLQMYRQRSLEGQSS